MASKKKIVGVVIACVAVVLLVCALSGAVVLKGAIDLVNKDKQYVKDSLISAFAQKPSGPSALLKITPEVSKKFGKLQEVTKLDGVPDLGDLLRGGEEFSYQISTTFEKANVTFFVRVSNLKNTPKLVSIEYKEGLFGRKRTRDEFKKMFR
jgi:hypothetical protein